MLYLLGFIVLICIISVHLFTSLWFVWNLLPADGDIAYAGATTDLPIQPLLDAFATSSVSPVILPTDQIRRFSVSLQGDTQVAVVVPTLRGQKNVQRKLAADNWRVERFGLVLRAVHGNTTLPSLGQATTQTIFSLMASRHSIAPTLIIRLSSAVVPALQNKTYVVGSWYDGWLRLSISETNRKSRVTVQPYRGDGLHIRVPGHTLNSIPTRLRPAWNIAIGHALGFTATTPDLIGYLAQYEVVEITMQETGSSVAVTGAADAFTAAATTWVQAEDSYHNPVRQAFRLPDRSLGYERVSGPTRDVFMAEQEGCLAPRPDRATTWICRTSDGATLATSQELARSAGVERVKGGSELTWRLEASGGRLGLSKESGNDCTQKQTTTWAEFLCSINTIALAGDDTQASAAVTFHEKSRK